MRKIAALIIIFFTFVSISFAETVVFNVKTHKMHKPSCTYAQKCTVNCIKLEKTAAIKRSGISCKKCGG